VNKPRGWKFSFYLRKHVLHKLQICDGIYYILKRKGVRRFDLQTRHQHKENLYECSYWDRLVNRSKDSIFNKAQVRHESGSLISKKIIIEDDDLKARQKYAVERVQGKILDLGCFDGKLLCHLTASQHDCYGVDFNNYYLDIVKRKLSAMGCPQDKVKKGLFQKIPFASDQFDTVVSQETLEHFFFPGVMLAEIKRVLKPGGQFIGSVPLENRVDSPPHIIYYTFPGIKNLLSRYFTSDELITIKSKPTDKKDNLII